MKKILVLLIVSFSLPSFAALTDVTYRNSDDYYAWAAIGFVNSGNHTISDNNSAAGSNLSGIIAIGGDFEYMMDYDFGIAGLVRYYSTSDDLDTGSGSTKYTFSVFSVSGEARFHFPSKSWDFYFAPGIGFSSATYKVGSTKFEAGLTITPTFTTGVALAISRDISVGVENHRIIGLGETLNGEIISDYMLKGRFSF